MHNHHPHPKFSIITVTYNAAKVLEDTIQSIVTQTYKNLEYIIVDVHEETDKLLDQYGLLKVKADQYEALDKAYILAHKKEEYGYSCLTNERQYYQENYPDITIEKGKIDDVIIMMKRGQQE